MDNIIKSTGATDEDQPVQLTEEQQKLEKQRRDEAEKMERASKCAQDIKEALAKWNCQFDISMLLKPTGIFPNVQLMAKEDVKTENIPQQ